jgi:hypothetical protein
MFDPVITQLRPKFMDLPYIFYYENMFGQFDEKWLFFSYSSFVFSIKYVNYYISTESLMISLSSYV